MDEYDVVIVGSGPAGLTAGIYAGRQGLKTLILEKALSGGSGAMVPMMENYPGFELISGKDLIEKTKEQALKYAEINENDEVKKIEVNDNEIRISARNGEYKAKSLILCTGTTHRKLNVPGESEFLGRGVGYCAVCDGPLFIGKKVLIIGGGNTAVQDALYLDTMGAYVALVHRRDELRAEKYLQDKLKEKELPVMWDTVVEEIKGDMTVKSVLLYNKKTGEKEEVLADGVFITIGELPINQLAESIGVELDRAGYIKTDEYQRTNIPMIYAAGDITVGINQWIIACAEGAIAALSAYRDLQ